MRRFVSLRVWHPDCWMLELSERNPDIRLDCRGVHAHGGFVETNVVIRSATRDGFRSALDESIPQDVHAEILHVGRDWADVYSKYPASRSLYQTMVEAGFLIVGPVTHENGSERWEVLADTDRLEDGLAHVRRNAEVDVMSVREPEVPQRHLPAEESVGRIAESLTNRQWQILGRAVEEGYYSWPRRKNVKRIAEDLGISGPTCLEHLRRAESRVIPAIIEELRRGRRF